MIPTINRLIKVEIAPVIIPAMLIPFSPAPFFRAMMPRMIAGIPSKKPVKVTIEVIPRTIEAIARPAPPFGEGVGATWGGTGATGGRIGGV